MDKMNWWTRVTKKYSLEPEVMYVLVFGFKPGEVSTIDIINFMNCLYNSGIIYKEN